TGGSAFLFAGLIGFGVGAEVDVLGYLIPRYFGRQAYGKIYAVILSAFEIGAGLGSTFVGAIRTSQASYTPALWALAAVSVVVMLLFARLGPYVKFTHITDTPRTA